MDSPFLELLKNRINLTQIPFSERGSRLMVFRTNHSLAVRLAERWFKRVGSSPPIARARRSSTTGSSPTARAARSNSG